MVVNLLRTKMESQMKALIFDLDQTLVDRNKTFLLLLKKQYERNNLCRWVESLDEYLQVVSRYDENGYNDKMNTFESVADALNIGLSGQVLFDDFTDNYGDEVFLFDQVHETLAQLQTNYKLGLITNGRSIGQNRKIDYTGIRDYFDTILISESEGVKKPDPVIYQRCLTRLEVSVNEAVYIGDHPINDIAAPMSIGLKAIWVENMNYAPPENCTATVQSVSELLDFF
jgi:putative hydrolase of the HAD superfamily